MAISATRFNFLEKEMNVAVKDFTELADNFVYNAPIDNIAQQASEVINNVTVITEPIESSIKSALQSVKTSLNSSGELTNTIQNLGNELSDFLPIGMDLNIPGQITQFQSMFGRISNLSSSSLCDLINMALGISILSMLLNLSPDMMKRLFMLALLALLARLCNQKFNNLSNPKGLINVDDFKQIGNNVFKDILRVNKVGSVGSILNKNNNPLYKVLNQSSKKYNPINKPDIIRTNPNVGIWT